MSGRGGRRPGAGRPKGSKDGALTKRNIRSAITKELIAKAKSDGVMPLQVMLEAMREYWDNGDKASAASVAKDAAPYCHPKLANIEHSGHMSHIVSHDDAMAEIEEIITSVDVSATDHGQFN